MQPSRFHDNRAHFVQSNPVEPMPPDPVAVLRAYSGGVGLPSDRWKLDIQARLVGAVLFVLAGICLLMTVVLLLALWLPAWLVALGLTVALTALGLALFASVSRPPIYASAQAQAALASQPATDLSGIEEIDPGEVESMRDPEFVSEPATPEPQRLTPHPIIAARAVDVDADSDADTDSDPDAEDAKTRPLGDAPPPASARKPLRAEMPSNVGLNH
ncbi:MAG TPA: hypothetical protein VI197_18195 [Polyangiaceae bacterium]